MFPSSRRVAAGITCLLPGDTLPLINRRHSTHNQPVVTTTTTMIIIITVGIIIIRMWTVLERREREVEVGGADVIIE